MPAAAGEAAQDQHDTLLSTCQCGVYTTIKPDLTQTKSNEIHSYALLMVTFSMQPQCTPASSKETPFVQQLAQLGGSDQSLSQMRWLQKEQGTAQHTVSKLVISVQLP